MCFIYKHAVKRGSFRTAAGYPAHVLNVSPDKIISGFVLFGNHKMDIQWDENGAPINLPDNQYLNLIPLREVTTLEPIPLEERK